MKSWSFEPSPEPQSELVDAIEEGKIVKVSLDYAKKEGLTILRKSTMPSFHELKKTKQFSQEERISIDELRKPLRAKKSQVIASLIENFQWEIAKKRRSLGFSRKQLALSINESESAIKLLENGILQKDDFVLINKIQERLNLNLRKDQQDFIQPARKLLKEEPAKPNIEKSSSQPNEELIGSDIQLIEDDEE